VCKVVREDERLAHTLDGEQPVSGIVVPVCEKYFCGDTGTEGGDEIKNIVLSEKRQEKDINPEKVKLRGLKSGVSSSWGI